MASKNTKTNKWVMFHIILLYLIAFGVPVGQRLKEDFIGPEAGTRWLDADFCFYDKSRNRRCEISLPEGGPTRFVLLSELGEPLVELVRDMEAGGGKIKVYDRQGDVVWQAP